MKKDYSHHVKLVVGLLEIVFFVWWYFWGIDMLIAARDPIHLIWEKHYRPVAQKMVAEYGKVEFVSFRKSEKGGFILFVRCSTLTIRGEGKDFEAAFKDFYDRAMPPDVMPYEEDPH